MSSEVIFLSEVSHGKIQFQEVRVRGNKNLLDEVKKNIAGQFLAYNSKNFQLLNKQLDLERTMSGLEKPFQKKSDEKKNKKKTENQCQNAARENKKPLVRYLILILTNY